MIEGFLFGLGAGIGLPWGILLAYLAFRKLPSATDLMERHRQASSKRSSKRDHG